VYHHIYDFGNTGIFISLGREKRMAMAERDKAVVKRACTLGIAIDERICDGLYFANSIKLVNKYLANPYLLEEELEEIVEDII
jgi:pyruvate/2-oxoglutarate dehydrogenase complex dihydrolipoamide acyltransferase (E2) component